MRDKQIMIDGVKYNPCNDCELWDGHHCIGARSYEPNANEHKAICNEHMAKQFYKVYQQLYRKTQECESLKEEIEVLKDNFDTATRDYNELIEELKQECEELKKQLMQKSEVDMFFNTPIEGWSNDPCEICPHKAENEELKKEIINKNEKIKELRFSVSDLTNRLCYLNAEKSFRIVDLEQTLDEIEKELKEDIYCENQECGCDDFEECLKCTKEYILDIINKAKDGE